MHSEQQKEKSDSQCDLDVPTLVHAFDAVFLPTYSTGLVGGFSEPIYIPGDANKPAEIRFTHDYIRSALHEIAHWCLAGEDRRKLVDYGYWYSQDGRNSREQIEFFSVEVKPQALEWAFSQLLQIPFEVSCDNLNGPPIDKESFEQKVANQLNIYKIAGFPSRARQLMTEVLPLCTSSILRSHPEPSTLRP